MKIIERLNDITLRRWKQEPSDCTNRQIYEALLELCQQLCMARPAPKGKRKLYYFSAEFLTGKLLSNNLLALGIYDELQQELEKVGRSLAEIAEEEPEPSLGNGGLGRLAACFLDSIAAQSLPGDGVGLCYHYGLFRQILQNEKQREEPNPWIEADSWLRNTGLAFEVTLGKQTIKAVMKDILIPGAYEPVANRLHLFDVEEPAPAPERGIQFDPQDIAHCLTSFLYPDDSTEEGRKLRLYQQYFLVSAGAQLILHELWERGFEPQQLSEQVVIQINDTHPSLIIPELIRLLVAKGLALDQAIEQVSRTCAYTNHTILAEALEKWPLTYIQEVAPQLVPILRELDQRARQRSSDGQTVIIDAGGLVHMAHMDIHFSRSVNGVAALHTDILRQSELKSFYRLYPERFTNKTNGITLRRWLQIANPALTELITRYIGDGWKQRPAELEKLMAYREDEELLEALLRVKQENKARLADELKARQGVEVDRQSIFDIQIKRLHEYKRQQMNALWVIQRYKQIKQGNIPRRATTVIFGAKAAPAYVMAKHIIHLILCLQKLTESDSEVGTWLKVVMVENYNVTWAEKLIPACDISEQISLASKEASGTGNMKCMANGAVTLGTLDGANVEIAQLVGPENIYTFGASSDEVVRLYAEKAYHSADYYHRPQVEELVDFLVSPELLSIGDPQVLSALWQDLKQKDWFMTLLDTEAYIQKKQEILDAYEDRMGWARKMLVNIAKSGYFSSDRTIEEYNQEIWKL